MAEDDGWTPRGKKRQAVPAPENWESTAQAMRVHVMPEMIERFSRQVFETPAVAAAGAGTLIDLYRSSPRALIILMHQALVVAFAADSFQGLVTRLDPNDMVDENAALRALLAVHADDAQTPRLEMYGRVLGHILFEKRYSVPSKRVLEWERALYPPNAELERLSQYVATDLRIPRLPVVAAMSQHMLREAMPRRGATLDREQEIATFAALRQGIDWSLSEPVQGPLTALGRL